MKSITLFLFVLLLSVGLKAQNSEQKDLLYSIADLIHVTNNNNHKLKTTQSLLKTENFDSTTVLDSVLSINDAYYSKIIYYYNPKKNQDSVKILIKNYNSNWSPLALTVYKYNTAGKRISFLSSVWNGEKWENFSRQNFSYDSNGNNILTISEKWKNNKWEKERRITRTYDVNNNITSEVYETGYRNTWEKRTKHTYQYDSDLNLTLKLITIWKNEHWENTSKYLFTYVNNNLTKKTLMIWKNSEWENDQKYSYLYANSQGTTILSSDFHYKWDGSNWKIIKRTKYTHNSNLQTTSALLATWNGSEWTDSLRITYTYNSNGKITRNLSELWNGTKWVNSSKINSDYDSYGNTTAIYSNCWENNMWVPCERQLELTDSFGRKYKFLEQKIYAYYSLITDISEKNFQKNNYYFLSQNFPNPFNPSTKIRYSIPNIKDRSSFSVQLKIYNLLGEEITTLVNEQQSPGNYQVIFNAEGLPSGTYFYQLRAGNFIETKKLLLLK